jgi:hypothetical protein
MSNNPLTQFFRTPAIHLPLPSKGKFYKEGAIEMPESGEVPVLPMSALDEITYKTPDALFNGSAVADVIKSCVPAIKDPWSVPVMDLTAILTAIRIASGGHNMEIETTCPKCKETADYELDLRVVLDSIVAPDYTKPLIIGDLTIGFKSMSYRDLNENNKLKFEEDKMTQVLTDAEIDIDSQVKQLSESFKKISKLTILTLAKNIDFISTPEETVSNEEHILEFLQNCENNMYKKIKSVLVEQKAKEVLEPLRIKCSSCEHDYKQEFTLDMTSFFEQNS